MKQLLIVDDDEMILEMLKLFFEDKGFETLTAADPQKARLLYEMHPDSIVITDMFMPFRGGFGLIKDLKDHFPNVKIIAMSGGIKIGFDKVNKGKQKSLDLAKGYGVHSVFQKPLNLNELLGCVLSLNG